MEKYIAEKKISFSATEEQEFRNLLNRWSKSEEGYESRPIGKDVKIVDVTDGWVYAATLKSQCDKRTLEWDFEPTTANYTPTITSPDQVDRWAYWPLPTSFTEAKSKKMVEESRVTKTCHTCNGKGKVTCPECRGSGKVKKKRSVEKTCGSCGGRGSFTSTSTESYWGYPGSQIKYNCGGDGRIYMTETKTHTHTCSTCKGSGKVFEIEEYTATCDECRGSGRVMCTTCKGLGSLLHYINVNRTRYLSDSTRYFAPNMMNADVTKEISLFIPQWEKLDQFRIEPAQTEAHPACSLPVVGAMTRRLVTSVTNTQETKTCFSNLTMLRCRATVVRYTYRDKEYRCVLMGPDRKLFAVSSPISDYADELRVKTNVSAKENKVGQTWLRLKQILKFSQSTARDKEALEQVEERMRLTAYYGKQAGALLTLLLLYPLITFYLTYYNIVAPWVEIVNYLFGCDVDAPFRAVVGMGIAYILIKDTWLFHIPKWVYRFSSGFVRTTMGLLFGILSALGALIIVAIFNYLGLLHVGELILLLVVGLFTTVLYILLLIIQFIILQFK